MKSDNTIHLLRDAKLPQLTNSIPDILLLNHVALDTLYNILNTKQLTQPYSTLQMNIPTRAQIRAPKVVYARGPMGQW